MIIALFVATPVLGLLGDWTASLITFGVAISALLGLRVGARRDAFRQWFR
jgi:hypothetical protein